MLALYRSGRQADALDVYRRGRRQLRDGARARAGRGAPPARAGHPQPRPRDCARAPAEPPRANSRRGSRAGDARARGGAVVLAGAIAGVLLSRSPDHSAVAAVVPAHSLAVVTAGTDPDREDPARLDSDSSSRSAHTRSGARRGTSSRAPRPGDADRVVRTSGSGSRRRPSPWATGRPGYSLPSRELIRIDPAYDLVRTTRVPLGRSSDLSVGDSAGSRRVAERRLDRGRSIDPLRLAPGTGTVIRRLRLGHGIDGVTSVPDSIWVTRGSPATLLRVDPQTGRVTARIPIAMTRGSNRAVPDRRRIRERVRLGVERQHRHGKVASTRRSTRSPPRSQGQPEPDPHRRRRRRRLDRGRRRRRRRADRPRHGPGHAVGHRRRLARLARGWSTGVWVAVDSPSCVRPQARRSVSRSGNFPAPSSTRGWSDPHFRCARVANTWFEPAGASRNDADGRVEAVPFRS